MLYVKNHNKQPLSQCNSGNWCLFADILKNKTMQSKNFSKLLKKKNALVSFWMVVSVISCCKLSTVILTSLCHTGNEKELMISVKKYLTWSLKINFCQWSGSLPSWLTPAPPSRSLHFLPYLSYCKLCILFRLFQRVNLCYIVFCIKNLRNLVTFTFIEVDMNSTYNSSKFVELFYSFGG